MRKPPQCYSTCEYTYKKSVDKVGNVHHKLYCSNHGFIANIERSEAEHDIAEGVATLEEPRTNFNNLFD